MKARKKLLCMVPLDLVPEALSLIREHTDLDYRPYGREYLLANIHRYDAFWAQIDIKIDREVLDRAVRLKVINTATTGTDNIDKAYAATRGITILSIAQDIGLLNSFTATAELAWMLLLGCARHFRPAMMSAMEGKWEMARYRGDQLSGATLGVLGVGRLGRMTVEYGKAFRMNVLGCDTRAFDIPGVEQVDFDTLLAKSDALSIHIHMTPENHHLFRAETFEKMKPGAILVNTSRGDIIDETALLHALESGKLKAFGTDVLHDEWSGDMSTSPVIQYARTHDNVVVTPHIGGNTTQSVQTGRLFSAKKLLHYLERSFPNGAENSPGVLPLGR